MQTLAKFKPMGLRIHKLSTSFGQRTLTKGLTNRECCVYKRANMYTEAEYIPIHIHMHIHI